MNPEAVLRWQPLRHASGKHNSFWKSICYSLNLGQFRQQAERRKEELGTELRYDTLPSPAAYDEHNALLLDRQTRGRFQNTSPMNVADFVDESQPANYSTIVYMARRYNLLFLICKQVLAFGRLGQDTWYKVGTEQPDDETILLMMHHNNDDDHLDPMWFRDGCPVRTDMQALRGAFLQRLESTMMKDGRDMDNLDEYQAGDEQPTWACFARQFLDWSDGALPVGAVRRA